MPPETIGRLFIMESGEGRKVLRCRIMVVKNFELRMLLQGGGQLKEVLELWKKRIPGHLPIHFCQE